MNRRGFLGALAGAIAGATLDPERALWRPGKLISVPAERVRKLHHFHVAFEIQRHISPQVYESDYVLPAVASINASLDREMRKIGVRRCVPQPLDAPTGCTTTMFGPIRSVVAFDPVTVEYVGRLDLAVMI